MSNKPTTRFTPMPEATIRAVRDAAVTAARAGEDRIPATNPVVRAHLPAADRGGYASALFFVWLMAYDNALVARMMKSIDNCEIS
jgi:hypothetical protein